MSDDDEITGVHELPPHIRMVVVSLHDRHTTLAKGHEKLEEKVETMKTTVDDIHTDIKAVKMASRIIMALIAILAAIGGGHLALMHH